MTISKLSETTGRVVWVHRATFSYRLDRPPRKWQTLWVFRPGWGYMKRRDIWTALDLTEEDARNQGFAPLKPASDPEVHVCRRCGLHMESIPGSLRKKHQAACGGNHDEARKLDEIMIQDQRMRIAEQKLRLAEMQKRLEQEAEQKKERFDKIREETGAKQLLRNRRQQLRDEAREQLIET